MLRSSIITRKLSASLNQFRMWGRLALLQRSPPVVTRSTSKSYQEMDEFFPYPPDCRLKHLYDPHNNDFHHHKIFEEGELNKFYIEEPKYRSYIQQVANIWSTRILDSGEEAEFLDVCSLLSFSNISSRNFLVNKRGEPVPLSSLTGKHVVVCCCFVPLQRDDAPTEDLRAIRSSYLELCESRSDFQIVMVAKIRSYWAQQHQGKTVFDHFFSGLPDDCLAIPYDDFYSREAVCLSLGLGTPDKESLAALLVHPDGRVLDRDFQGRPRRSGAQSFLTPSDYDYSLDWRMLGAKMWCNLSYALCLGGAEKISKTHQPVLLEQLLGCKSLQRVGSDQQVQLSDLSNSIIGVYFCFDGRFLDDLNEIHQQCLAQGKDFVIVLVCLPFEQDPSSFYNHIKDAMEKRNISSWLVFPFKDSICRWLWKLSGRNSTDQLIILPHFDSSGQPRLGEFEGKAVMKYFGASAYPFTKESILENKLSCLKSINLMNLLAEFSYVVRNNEGGPANMSVDDLRGRNIILYIDSVAELNTRLYDILLDLYPKIQAKYPGSEVLFAPLDSSDHKDARVSEMQWPRLPSFSASLTKQLFFDDIHLGSDDPHPTLLAFGEGGNLVRRYVHFRNDDLFHDSLQRELVDSLRWVECEDC